MARSPGPRFAAGMVFGFPRVLAAAATSSTRPSAAGLFGATLAGAALRVSESVSGSGPRPFLAAAVAFALTLAVAVPTALSIVADAAVARAGVCGDGPGEAFLESAARFLARPGTFLVAALAFGAAGLVAPGLLAGVGSVATSLARLTNPLLALGPELMLGVAGAAVAAAVDLVFLGTIAALACGGDPGGSGAWGAHPLT
jgi:hypothetical protein